RPAARPNQGSDFRDQVAALDAERTVFHDVEITEKLPRQRIELPPRRALRHGSVELAPACTGTLGERTGHEGFVVDRVDEHIEAADRVASIHAQRPRDDDKQDGGDRQDRTDLHRAMRSATRASPVTARRPRSASSWGESPTGPGACRPGKKAPRWNCLATVSEARTRSPWSENTHCAS